MADLRVAIREVSIRNFRGIEQLDLSFLGPDGEPTQVVVLAGPNGCGKTAVLEACLLAFDQQELVRGSKEVAAIRRGANSSRIRVAYCRGAQNSDSDSEPARDHELILHCEPGVSLHKHQAGESFEPIQTAYYSSWRAPTFVGAVGISLGGEHSPSEKTESHRLRTIKQSLVNFRAHALFPSSSSGEAERESRFSRAIADLNCAWQMFYPQQSLAVEPVGDDPDAGFDVFVHGAASDRLSVDSLSSGQIEVFAFVGMLVVEEFVHGIIFVDEPELHLDPQWHRLVLKTLLHLKPEAQVIAGTHSPEIYDSVRSFERHFLVPADDPRAAAWAGDKSPRGVDE